MQVHPSPALPDGERMAGVENGLRCFPEPRPLGAVVSCLKRVSLCRMQLPEARFGSPLRRGLGTERPSWLRGHDWCLGAEAFARPILLPKEGDAVGSGFLLPETSSKAAGPRDPRAAQFRFALWRTEGRGRKWIALLS